MICCFLAKIIRDAEFNVKFPPNIPVSAASLDLWARLKKKFFHPLVDNSYSGKVTKAFPEIPSGYGAAVKRSAWG